MNWFRKAWRTVETHFDMLPMVLKVGTVYLSFFVIIAAWVDLNRYLDKLWQQYGPSSTQPETISGDATDPLEPVISELAGQIPLIGALLSNNYPGRQHVESVEITQQPGESSVVITIRVRNNREDLTQRVLDELTAAGLGSAELVSDVAAGANGTVVIRGIYYGTTTGR